MIRPDCGSLLDKSELPWWKSGKALSEEGKRKKAETVSVGRRFMSRLFFSLACSQLQVGTSTIAFASQLP
jgi:hypothetical protein